MRPLPLIVRAIPGSNSSRKEIPIGSTSPCVLHLLPGIVPTAWPGGGGCHLTPHRRTYSTCHFALTRYGIEGEAGPEPTGHTTHLFPNQPGTENRQRAPCITTNNTWLGGYSIWAEQREHCIGQSYMTQGLYCSVHLSMPGHS